MLLNHTNFTVKRETPVLSLYIIRHIFIVTLTLLLVSLILPDFATAGDTGALNGSIKDENGKPLIGASVVLTGTSMGAATDSKGNFLIFNIKYGSYDIRFSMIGYQAVIYQNVTILPDIISSLDIILKQSTLSMEEVVVEAASPLIRRDITGSLHELGREKIQNIPVNTLEEIAGLQVGVTRDGYIRGGRRNEVLYLIDGLPANDLITGGLGTDLPKSSIERYTLQTGGIDAEYGDALSGVINISTSTSKDKTVRSFRFKSDNLQGGTEHSKESEAELYLSGPLRNSNLSYLVSGTFNSSSTRWWQDMDLYFDSPTSSAGNLLSKLEMNFGRNKTLAIQGIYSSRKWRDYEFSWRFNLSGLPKRKRDSLRLALFWSHSLSNRILYTISLSRYDIQSRIGEGSPDQLSVEPWQYDILLRYVISGNRNWWEKTNQTNYTIKSDIQSKLFDRHLFKAGVNLNLFNVNSEIIKLEPRKTYFGKPKLGEDLLNYSNSYEYRPRSGSIYIQDKIVSGYDGSTVSVGVRLDFLDPRASRPAIELIPISENEFEQNVSSFVPASVKYNISPRLGFSAPLTDKAVMFLTFGQYFQNPLFEQLYSGLSNTQFRFGNSVLRGNPDLEPETTRAIEISLKYRLPSHSSFSAVYYQKETTNQIDSRTLIPTNSRIAGDYGFSEFVNNPFAKSSGFEFIISRKGAKKLNGNISYVLGRAKGLSENTDQGLNFAQWGFEVPSQIYFMSWDQRHTFKGDLLFETSNNYLFSLLWEVHSGRPFTFFPSSDGVTAENPDQPFIPNNRRLPSSKIVDIQLSKRFILTRSKGKLSGRSVMVYFTSRNLLDSKNAIWADSSGKLGGELDDPSAFDIGRRSFIGITVDL